MIVVAVAVAVIVLVVVVVVVVSLFHYRTPSYVVVTALLTEVLSQSSEPLAHQMASLYRQPSCSYFYASVRNAIEQNYL